MVTALGFPLWGPTGEKIPRRRGGGLISYPASGEGMRTARLISPVLSWLMGRLAGHVAWHGMH